MIIQYKAIFTLLGRYYVLKSLEGLISDCYENYENAIKEAHSLEDYEFLQNLEVERELNDKRYVFFWDYGHMRFSVLEKNKPLSIDSMANLSFSTSNVIDKAEFISLIEATADNLQIECTSHIERFEEILQMKKNFYKLHYGKPGRNEPCPCGSFKKYKYCHGAAVIGNQ